MSHLNHLAHYVHMFEKIDRFSIVWHGFWFV
jgi:hypothetical protein